MNKGSELFKKKLSEIPIKIKLKIYGGMLSESSERIEELENMRDKIKNWCDAYPVKIFPEPDFGKVRKVLEKNGMTLDAISASNMRYVLDGIKKILEEK